ncbi:MAG TPA: Hsp20/alpha crystallin family protein [Pseudonocardiaceae bacterium]|jgi:HSP20 family protein|nr:Hsp20/alpha crystallin family protein [Pseudonocardiaceae bacterium]
MPPKKHRNPFRGVSDIVSEMHRMSDRMMGADPGPATSARGHTDAWSPATDILARGSDLVIRCELPGVPASDVDVHLSNGALTIEGHRDRGPEPDESFYVQERYWGQFRRVVSLPQGVHDEDVEAELDEGVLEIVVRNCAEASGPKPIRIKSKSKPPPARP